MDMSEEFRQHVERQDHAYFLMDMSEEFRRHKERQDRAYVDYMINKINRETSHFFMLLHVGMVLILLIGYYVMR